MDGRVKQTGQKIGNHIEITGNTKARIKAREREGRARKRARERGEGKD